MAQEAAAPSGSAGTQFGVRLQSLQSGKAGSRQRSAQGPGQQHDHQEVCFRARACQCSRLDALCLLPLPLAHAYQPQRTKACRRTRKNIA